jgi:hypothetical protein
MRSGRILERLAHQPQCRPTIAPALNQHIEDLALFVDGTLQIHLPAGDPHDHLVEPRCRMAAKHPRNAADLAKITLLQTAAPSLRPLPCVSHGPLRRPAHYSPKPLGR